jgi:glycine/D-amino acid oxidase-like deaminating enzyme
MDVSKMTKTYDAIVLGAGYFGLRIAQNLRESGMAMVLVLEAEDSPMQRASYVNQARVHNGYHYPRSILTAFRSRISSDRFIAENSPAIKKDFEHVYAIAKSLSKTNARQFEEFCNRIGAPLSPAPSDLARQFSPRLIEKTWLAQEFAFDSNILRELVMAKILELGGIEIKFGTKVATVSKASDATTVKTENGQEFNAPTVIASLYAGTNELHKASGLPLLPIQYEVAEMALVQMPKEWKNRAITVMDGPFFSLVPFPSENLHTFSHVRYTPQVRWEDTEGSEISKLSKLDLDNFKSTFREMKADLVRYLPTLSEISYVKSIREIKTVLAKVDLSDSRPVLVRGDFGIPGYYCVLGGKIDNIFDVIEELHVQLGL